MRCRRVARPRAVGPERRRRRFVCQSHRRRCLGARFRTPQLSPAARLGHAAAAHPGAAGARSAAGDGLRRVGDGHRPSIRGSAEATADAGGADLRNHERGRHMASATGAAAAERSAVTQPADWRVLHAPAVGARLNPGGGLRLLGLLGGVVL